MVQRFLKVMDRSNEISNFESFRNNSVFCRLSLKNCKIDWYKCKRLNFYPFAYILYLDNNLAKIDRLFYKFNIEPGGSVDFKNRLKDSIFKNNSADLNKYNAVKAALSELLIADFLAKNEIISGLEARHSCNSDIKSKNIKDNITYETEVKYLGMIPERYNRIKDQIQADASVSFGAEPDALTQYTYLNMRIVDGIIQLQGISSNTQDRKRIFILLESESSIIARNFVLNTIQEKCNWDNAKLSDLCNKLDANPQKYIQKRVKRGSSLHTSHIKRFL